VSIVGHQGVADGAVGTHLIGYYMMGKSGKSLGGEI
jgi:hypothetical protein